MSDHDEICFVGYCRCGRWTWVHMERSASDETKRRGTRMTVAQFQALGRGCNGRRCRTTANESA